MLPTIHPMKAIRQMFNFLAESGYSTLEDQSDLVGLEDIEDAEGTFNSSLYSCLSEISSMLYGRDFTKEELLYVIEELGEIAKFDEEAWAEGREDQQVFDEREDFIKQERLREDLSGR